MCNITACWLPYHALIWFQGDGRYLITNSKDQTIKLWDIRKFSSQKAIDATLQEVQQQSWDYRWQSVPRKGTAVHVYTCIYGIFSHCSTIFYHCHVLTAIMCNVSIHLTIVPRPFLKQLYRCEKTTLFLWSFNYYLVAFSGSLTSVSFRRKGALGFPPLKPVFPKIRRCS